MAENINFIARLRNEFSPALKKIKQDLTEFTGKVREFDEYGKKSGKFRMKEVGNMYTSIGKTMMAGIVLPMGITAGAVASSAIRMEKNFAGIRKTVNKVFDDVSGGLVEVSEVKLAEALNQTKKEIDEIALRSPLMVRELYDIARAAGQTGLGANQISGMVDMISKLSVASDELRGPQAALQIARLAGVTKTATKDFERLGSTIAYLGNNLAATEAEIVDISMRFAPMANMVGFTQQQILGWAASIRDLGIGIEVAGTSISQILFRINDGVAEGDKRLDLFAMLAGLTQKKYKELGKAAGADIFKQMKKDFKELWKTNPSRAMLQMAEGIKAATDAGIDLLPALKSMKFDGHRVLQTFLAMAASSPEIRKNLEDANKAWEENTALLREAEIWHDMVASKLLILRNHLEIVGAAFGKHLLPILVYFIEVLMDVLVWFNGLSDTTKKYIIYGVAIAAVLLTIIAAFLILGGVLFLAVQAWAGWVAGFKLFILVASLLKSLALTPLIIAFKLLSKGVKWFIILLKHLWLGFKVLGLVFKSILTHLKLLYLGLKVVAAAMGLSVGWLIAIIIAIAVAAYLIYKYWDQIKVYFIKFWEYFKKGWKKIKEFFASLWNSDHWAAKLLKIFLLLHPFTMIPYLIMKNWDKLKAFFNGLWKAIQENIPDFLKGDKVIDVEAKGFKQTALGEDATFWEKMWHSGFVPKKRQLGIDAGSTNVDVNNSIDIKVSAEPGTKVESIKQNGVDLGQTVAGGVY